MATTNGAVALLAETLAAATRQVLTGAGRLG
jgi:hypothetical protein